MANYTTADIKELRAETGAGIKDVKNALEEAEGNREKALEIIRVKGQKSLSKREDRVAGNGLITAAVKDGGAGQIGIMVQVNAETDFVVKTDKFISLSETVLAAAVESDAADVASLLAAKTADGTVKDSIDALAATIGEKLEISGVHRLEGENVALYLHRSSADLPPTLGVLVATDAKGKEIGHDIALHVAASAPMYVTRGEVPAEEVEKERATLEEITRAEGKPEAALPKILEGRMNGFYKDIVLLDQAYAKDAKTTVGKVLEEAGGKVTGFVRVLVGE